MTRWIVNPTERTVVDTKTRELNSAPPSAGEFFYDAPTRADAMMAGERHLLAAEALRACGPKRADFVVIGERIEPKAASVWQAKILMADMDALLTTMGYDVWSEGVAIVVLRGPR